MENFTHLDGKKVFHFEGVLIYAFALKASA